MPEGSFVLSKEEETLLLLSRQTISLEGKKKVEKLINSDFDFNSFLDTAMNHQVFSLVTNNLYSMERSGLNLNIPVKSRMSILVQKQKRLKLIEMYQEETKRLSALFHKQGYKVVLLKGMALNKLIYKEPIRDCSDMDLLVSEIDAMHVYRILKNLGYIAYYDHAKVTDEEAKQIVKSHSCSFCEFIKEKDKFSFYLDLHLAKENSPEFLGSVYQHAILLEKEIYVPDLIDNLIFACMHGWRHYPHQYRINSLDALIKIKDLFDIRELYLEVERQELLEKLKKRGHQIGAFKVISEMLYVTERIYRTFAKDSFGENVRYVTHDYKEGTFESILERRILRPDEEQAMLVKYDAEHKKEQVQYPDYIAKRFNFKKYRDYNDEKFWDIAETYQIKENTFYIPYYGFNKSAIKGQRAEMSFGWSQEHFLIKLQVKDENYLWNSKNYFNDLHHRLILSFGGKSYPMLYVSLHEQGNHKIYVVKDGNRLYKNRELTDTKIYTRKLNNGYSCIVAIPWKETGSEGIVKNRIQTWINIETGEKTGLGHILLSPQNMSDMVYLLE